MNLSLYRCEECYNLVAVREDETPPTKHIHDGPDPSIADYKYMGVISVT